MILSAKIQAERGKEILRTANEYITILFNNRRENQYRVIFHDYILEVLDYSTGKITSFPIDNEVIEPCDVCGDPQCKHHDCIPL